LENSFKLVFSNYRYSTISILITLGLFFSLSIVSEYLFIEPYVVFAVYSDTAFNFSLIVVISILAGMVVSMNIFRLDTDAMLPLLQETPLHPERDEKELTETVRMLVREREDGMFTVPLSEPVPDLTNLKDISTVQSFISSNH